MQSNPQPTTVQHLARSWPGKMGSILVNTCEYWDTLRSFMYPLCSVSHDWQTYTKSSSNRHSNISPRLTSPDVTMIHPLLDHCLYLFDALLFKGFHVHPARFHHSPFFVVAGSEMFTSQTCCCWFKNPINAMLHKALIWHFKHMHLNSQLVKDLMDEDQPLVTGCISKSVVLMDKILQLISSISHSLLCFKHPNWFRMCPSGTVSPRQVCRSWCHIRWRCEVVGWKEDSNSASVYIFQKNI